MIARTDWISCPDCADSDGSVILCARHLDDRMTGDRAASCGECFTFGDHLPSCSAAPVSETAPAVLMFDRRARAEATR